MTNLFILTTRGSEAVSAAELAALPGVTVGQTAYRRVTAECSGSLLPLLGLRTVDDAYLDLGVWSGIGHTRDVLAVLQWYGTQIELESAAALLTALRPLPDEPLFSVTASFVGKRNYTTDEIKQNVAAGIRERFGLHYTPDDRAADLNVRVFIEHENAFVGVRVAKKPLHERSYKIVERAGSLKPSAAAALLQLAQIQPGERLLDPCCGTGTILIEAAQMGAAAHGGDLDAEAVAAAETNAQAAGCLLPLAQWDARTLPLADQAVERLVTNLPWGRQIALDDEIAPLYAAICGEIERVLPPDGQAAILTSMPELLTFRELQPLTTLEISLFGQTPTISLWRK